MCAFHLFYLCLIITLVMVMVFIFHMYLDVFKMNSHLINVWEIKQNLRPMLVWFCSRSLIGVIISECSTVYESLEGDYWTCRSLSKFKLTSILVHKHWELVGQSFPNWRCLVSPYMPFPWPSETLILCTVISNSSQWRISRILQSLCSNCQELPRFSNAS